MITAHVWRPLVPSKLRTTADPCQYMNCRRPRREHERAVKGWGR